MWGDDDFKYWILSLGGLQHYDLEFGFAFAIKQGKNEISVEADIERKKVICKVYEPHSTVKTYEFTLLQFKNMLQSNTIKDAVKSEEEKIHADLEQHKSEREPKDVVSARQPVKRRGPATKAAKTSKPAKTGKRASRKSSK